MAEKSSGQKTEKPTAKRLSEARRRGQIPRSPDLVSWVTLLIASYLLPPLIGLLADRYERFFSVATDAISNGQLDLALRGTNDLARGVSFVVVPFLFLMALLVIMGLVVQGGVTLSAQPLRPKAERISPLAGFKRLVSPQSLVDTGKAILRLTALAILMWRITDSRLAAFLTGSARAPADTGGDLSAAILLLVRLAALLGVVVGVGDYAFQRWKVGKQLRMTKDEVKRENRNTEGDPFTRSRRRSLHAKVSRNKMLAAVSEASVVVVNPTHISVALSYRSGAVPKVVAKGVDDLALRIRERAFEAGVPVVEAKPLARMLHDLIEVGEEVPTHLYEAVAIVIAFVMRLPVTALDRTVRRVSVPLSKLRPPDEDAEVGTDQQDSSRRSRRRRRPVGAR